MTNLPPNHRRFQLHLTTCVVLMFAAGILIYWNVVPPYESALEYTSGWPFELHWSNNSKANPIPWAIANGLICLTLLVAIAFGLEKWIHLKNTPSTSMLGAFLRSVIYRRICYSLFLFLIIGWAITATWGTEATSEDFYKLCDQYDGLNGHFWRRVRVSPTEFKNTYVDGKTHGVLYAYSPLPFIVKIRIIDGFSPQNDMAHYYCIWFLGYRSDFEAEFFRISK